MRRDGLVILQLWIDCLGKLFPQLDSHLIERVDVPDDALGKDLVLVKGDERAQSLGRELLEQNRVRRPIAWEGLGANENL